jgi:hypothetical protein
MHKPPLLTTNFAHLQEHDEQLLRLGYSVEKAFLADRLRQLTRKEEA